MTLGRIDISDAGLAVTSPPADDHKPVFVLARGLYAPAQLNDWPDGDADTLLEARVGRTVYVAREQIALDVERQAATGRPPVLVPEDALSETGTVSQGALMRSRFISGGTRKRRRAAAFRAGAAAVAVVLLAVAGVRFRGASRALAAAAAELQPAEERARAGCGGGGRGGG